MKRVLVLLGALLLSAGAAANDPATDKILECMRSNIPTTLRIQEFELTAVDRAKGKRVLKGKLYAKNDKGLVRAMIRILAPADLANASYLIREGAERDDMFVFLPALNRTKRITGANADSALFGTDLSYTDIKQIHNAFSGGPVKLESADKLGERAVHRLSMTPNATAQSRYSRLNAWVDTQTCVMLKMEFLEGSAVRKLLMSNPKSLKQSGTHWYSSEALMRDLKEGTQTTLRITGVTSGGKLSDNIFNATTFYIGG